MTKKESIKSYGINEKTALKKQADAHIEEIKNIGYTVVKSGFSEGKRSDIESAFEKSLLAQKKKFDKEGYLKSIDEHNTLRCPVLYDDIFTEVLNHSLIVEICRELIGSYITLNQQNGLINPPNKEAYSQGSYHRDLPYQHFTSSKPLAINALYAVEPFTKENGATFVIPASHKSEPFPSDSYIQKHQVQAEAEAGDFIVMDCMLYHSGGVNQTQKQRRAINNVYTIPMLKQQLNLPNILGEKYANDDELKQLLGYGLEIPDSIQSYYNTREK